MFKLSLKLSIILIVVLAVIATIGAVFIVNRYAFDNQPSGRPIEQTIPAPNFTKDVVIETDKTEYEEYETIKTIIKNNSDEEIYLSSVSLDTFEYKINEEWIALKEGPIQKTLSYVLTKIFPKEEIVQEIIPYWIWKT